MLDDATFARTWVESRDRARPRSEAALRRELALKGIDRELAAEVLDEQARRPPRCDRRARPAAAVTPTRPARARTCRRPSGCSAKRGGALARIADPRTRRQRAYALLARNGFDPEVCREATNRYFAAGPEPAAEPATRDD